MNSYSPGTYLTINDDRHRYLPFWNDHEALTNTYRSLDDFTCYFWESGCLGLYIGSFKNGNQTVGLFCIVDNDGCIHFGWQHIETVFRNVRNVY